MEFLPVETNLAHSIRENSIFSMPALKQKRHGTQVHANVQCELNVQCNLINFTSDWIWNDR